MSFQRSMEFILFRPFMQQDSSTCCHRILSLADVIGKQMILHKLQGRDLAKICQVSANASRLSWCAFDNRAFSKIDGASRLGYKDPVLFQEFENKILGDDTMLLVTPEEAKTIVKAFASLDMLSGKLHNALQTKSAAASMESSPMQE
ncbi:hypothetical protein GUITHDRAFT_102453 [Guillardia theta CCMP2712]|uniref:Uncharacterized protein n=1 Tax=Guillardia theta (strain CCMP2712) TaxID=905079 RepID=L1JTW2_GUITC|nr:hypothetical protein GUITHDRAFT_102453 [Guillardia theta CCMP2712]EKX51842.1 hypothetical protein GUITHDRAFT_102453 [Guillardia theta CCMP2712]|eukprot:XP_005838822.1 hypothetical protein GUITHDRAFT_102453 [Guillardia theta CCMP2712]